VAPGFKDRVIFIINVFIEQQVLFLGTS